MKIINKEEFIKLPEGTLFCSWTPCVFGEICIKGETISEESGDFFHQSLIQIDAFGATDEAAIQMDAAENGSSFQLNLSCQQRDGCFDWGDMYAVWEEDDLESLITKLLHLRRLRTNR